MKFKEGDRIIVKSSFSVKNFHGVSGVLRPNKIFGNVYEVHDLNFIPRGWKYKTFTVDIDSLENHFELESVYNSPLNRALS